MESGFYSSANFTDVYVAFGGKIHVCTRYLDNVNKYCLSFQELNKKVEVGGEFSEEWNKDKPSVYLIFNGKKEIDVLIKHLNAIKGKL